MNNETKKSSQTLYEYVTALSNTFAQSQGKRTQLTAAQKKLFNQISAISVPAGSAQEAPHIMIMLDKLQNYCVKVFKNPALPDNVCCFTRNSDGRSVFFERNGQNRVYIPPNLLRNPDFDKTRQFLSAILATYREQPPQPQPLQLDTVEQQNPAPGDTGTPRGEAKTPTKKGHYAAYVQSGYAGTDDASKARTAWLEKAFDKMGKEIAEFKQQLQNLLNEQPNRMLPAFNNTTPKSPREVVRPLAPEPKQSTTPPR